MNKNDLKVLIQYRLDEAVEALRDAEILLGAIRLRATANRLYYASFYAAIAMLLTKGIQSSKHSAVIAFFDREFIRPGILPKEYSRALHQAFAERQQDDYMPFVEMDPDELKQLFTDVQALVHGIAKYIQEKE